MNKKMASLFSVVFLGLIVGLAACTKKREAQFAYGEGLDLLKISDYDNKYFDLKTSTTNANLAFHTVSKSNLKTNGELQNYAYVKYETNSELFPKDILFIGKENSNYKLVYQITDSHLIVSKVGTKEEIPVEELTSAQKINETLFSVPLVTYRLSGLYTIDNARDYYQEKTSTLKDYKADTKAQATHFRIDKNSRQVLTLKTKTNLFLKNYFEGKWFTSTVISKVSDEESEKIGFTASFDSNQDSADKITFISSKEKISGLNARYDERIQLNDENDKRNNLAEAIRFPVQWISFKRNILNGDLNEVEDYEKRWDEREYVEVDFTKTDSLITQALKGNPSLTDMSVSDNFFMFSLQFQGVKVTFSFLKEQPKKTINQYQPKNYSSDDFKYFGYFKTQKKSLNTYEKYRRDDFERFTYINRFHPQLDEKTGRKKIIFHLTETSTLEPAILEATRAAIQSWDFAFKQVGLKDTDVILDETEKVAVGDIRYNAINLIKTLTASSLLGFGPSIADPDTGEIISATTNVHVTSVKSNLISQLRNYLRHRRGEMNENYPLGLSQSFQSPQLSSGATSKSLSSIQKFSHHVCDFDASAGDLVRDIESDQNKACLRLRQYAKANIQDLKEEAESLESCSDSLLAKKIQSTLIHELGHNFGLRHNFAASADKENYTHKKDPKTGLATNELLARSSSVMEYPSSNDDRLTEVGPYDIEAIRYGYADQILDSNGAVHKLDPTKTIDANLANLKVTKKNIRFCTDDHVELGMDPLCQRHDSGSTPLEVVESLIAQYNTLFATQNFRYDKAMSPSPQALKDYKQALIFDRMRVIYDQWRVYLTDFIGIEKQSLEVYNESSYPQVLAAMQADPQFKKYYQEYKPAADRIFNFLLDLTFMPSRYCLTQNSESAYGLKELTQLSSAVKNKTGLQPISCQDPEIKTILESQGLTLVKEVGFYHQHQKRGDINSHLIDFSQSRGNAPSTLDSYWDIIGSADDKDLAKDTLTKRTGETSSKNFFARQKNISSSFLDEPQYRKALQERLIERILQGINIEALLPELKGKQTNQLYFAKWREEFEHIRQTWNYMLLGISELGKDVMNNERTLAWASVRTTETEIINQAKEKMKLSDGAYILALSEENKLSIQLIQRLKVLEKMRTEKSKEYLENQLDFDAQYSLISHILKI